jgi:prevent-host-death family protein
MEDTVGLFDAKTHLSSLVERVARGERITITKHGTPVAVLVPPDRRGDKDLKRVAEEIRALRKSNFLRGLKIRDLINEGRRY